MKVFIIARNPQPKSALPFIVGLPLDAGMLWLKAADRWPRTARVYCHPLGDAPRLEELDVLERIEARVCRRVGAAIDLVLARRVNKRAQFAFVVYRGRELIFWQTAQTARAARPGLRVPGRQRDADVRLYIDTRERYGYSFAAHHVHVERRALPVGDYAAQVGETVIAAVERKRLDDFATSLANGSLNFAMAELTSVPLAAVAVEGTYSALMRHRFTRPGFLLELVARLQIRYPQIAINFLESRKIAEEWTYRFLCASYRTVNPGLFGAPLSPSSDGACNHTP